MGPPARYPISVTVASIGVCLALWCGPLYPCLVNGATQTPRVVDTVRPLESRRYLHDILPRRLHLFGSSYRLTETGLAQHTSSYYLSNFNHGNRYPARHTQSTISMTRTYSSTVASATTNAQEPCDLCILSSMLRFLELNQSELRPLLQTRPFQVLILTFCGTACSVSTALRLCHSGVLVTTYLNQERRNLTS